jgi:hypothetical protein
VYCKEFHGNIQKLAHRIPIVFGGVLNFWKVRIGLFTKIKLWKT